MSTKIFVHKQLKIKPPKAPDPTLDHMFEAARQEQERKAAQREQDRKLMAQLRAEELAKRAAKLPPPATPGMEFCCPRCWAIERGQMLFSKRKNLFRIWRAVEYNRPELLGDPWLKKAQLELGTELIKEARLGGVEMTGDELADWVILISKKVIAMGIDTFKEAHPATAAKLREDGAELTIKLTFDLGT